MLVLSRKIGERIIINNGEIVIEIEDIRRATARVGIQAPRGIPIHREEIQDAINRGEKESRQHG